jgi:hypothetical protein
MKACWKLIPRATPKTMMHEEYDGMYSTLLYEMTICWDEETNDAVLAKMWRRDASAFTDLNFDRFCCSIFYFAEMVSHNPLEDVMGLKSVLTFLGCSGCRKSHRRRTIGYSASSRPF